MRRLTYLFCFITVLFTKPLQGQINLNLEVRPRFELRDGYKKLLETGSTPAILISQRTRISMSYQTENFKIKFTPQDVRIWGDEQLSSSTGVYGDQSSLDMVEGYIQIKLSCLGWISAGRQQLAYNNERLLSKRNWNQNGLSYDALVIKTELKDTKLHIGSSWNNISDATTDNYYLPNRLKSLSFLWLNRKIAKSTNISLLHIASGTTATDTTNRIYFRQTTGLFMNVKHKKLHCTSEFYYQYGKKNPNIPISAFLAGINLAYHNKKLQAGIGECYLSGNNDNNDVDNLFDPLYGSRHRFYGHMDYYRNFSFQTNNGGLADSYAYIKYGPVKQLSIAVTGHYFLLARTNKETPLNPNLGYENEIELKYNIREYGCLKGAYLFYIPTDSYVEMLNLSSIKFPQFLYLELSVKTEVLSERVFQQK